jgi:hypothetical protein
MFRPAITQLTERVADLLDDMLVGDFEYIQDECGLYADVDYHRKHPHRVELRVPVTRRACNAPAPRALTPAGLRGRA